MISKNQFRNFILFFGVIIVFSFNSSCKRNNTSIDTSEDTLTFLYIGDERIFHQDYWGMEATYWIFLPLVTNVGDERGETAPVLAESWSHSKDYRNWTVHLRKDIFWHDGVQMTAHDIKFSFDLRNKVFGGYTRNLKCELIDDFTFNLILESPITDLPNWEVYYPKHLLDSLNIDDFYNWDFWKNPVGNGPYKFVRNVPKSMVEVEVNPNYFRSEPKIKKAILKFSQTPALQELLSGNVDALTSVPRNFLFKIKGDDRFNSYHWWGSWVETLLWNHNNPLFSEAKVRKALTLAINRAELSTVLNYPDSVPVADVLYSTNQRRNTDFPAPLSYDPDKAIQLLKECGWEDANEDGILDKNGADFKFELLVENRELMATYIQNNYQNIGVNMDIVSMERNIFKKRLKKNDFDAILTRFPNSESNLNRIRPYFGENSYIGYHNTDLENIFNLIGDTGDKNKIDSLYKKTMSIFELDIPVTFLFPQVQTHIVNKKIKGLQNNYKAGPVYFLEFLWIE